MEETQQELPEFGNTDSYKDSNVFRESFDVKEMERIQKILKGDKWNIIIWLIMIKDFDNKIWIIKFSL